MSSASNLEQYMLELINAERAAVGLPPLAFNSQLNAAAEQHTQWMLGADVFSHSGDGGSSPGDRMAAAGYVFSGSWTWGENIAWQSTRGEPGLQDDVANMHQSLMNSSGHRANILDDDYREIGLGVENGDFEGWDAAMVTQNFAKSGSDFFLVGVAYDDRDGDGFYDAGEGLGGLTVQVVDSGGQMVSTATTSSGGYQVALGNGSYTVTFSGSGQESESHGITIDGSNVKLDFGGSGGGGNSFVGDDGNNTMTGSAGSDQMEGRGGRDTIHGLHGDDRMLGNAGADSIYGNQGQDMIYGNQDADKLFGGQHEDRLFGGQDDDVIYGNFQDDVIYGNFGDDVLIGGQDDDVLFGGQDDDQLFGNRGDDVLIGNRGNDTLWGGADADLFIFAPGAGFDEIKDFQAGLDAVLIQGTGAGLAQSGEDVLVTLGSGDVVSIENVTIAEIEPDIFFA